MGKLRNLKKLGEELQLNFEKVFKPNDIELPNSFKNSVKELNGYKYDYKKYLVHIYSENLNGYIPNLWFVIASFFVDYYQELQKYKTVLVDTLKSCGLTATDERKTLMAMYSTELGKKPKTVTYEAHKASTISKVAAEITKVLNNTSSIDEEDKKYLIYFVSNYDWWYGGKSIDRGDFYVSPILALSKVVNASHTYIAEICKSFAEMRNVSDALRDEYEQNISPNIDHKIEIKISNSRQQIFYGAPGTGKSHKIKVALGEMENTPEKKKVPTENIFRTTFHPDSDYSTFVGAYKPTMKKHYRYDGKIKAKYYEDDDLAGATKDETIIDKVIEYDFVPQTFIKAYMRAYQTEENVYLVIEEINRGNCAQIFGDLFQLLDRDENGVSEYKIKADADIVNYLEEKLGKNSAGIKDGELCLPSNLYIYATMNTSDQSLFPIDSAFKRRWDWEYEPIKYKNKDWAIEINGNKYLWTSFQKKVNEKIFGDTNSEDKMLGDYFVKANNENVISEKLFVNKVLFYLWNDVCKDGDNDIFKIDDKTDVKFSDLYGDNGTKMLLGMMKHLDVELLEYWEDDYIEESEFGNPNTLYSINDGEPFKKTYLAAKVFQEYVKHFSGQTASDVLGEWNKKRAEWKNVKISIPKHLIENAEGYTEYLKSSKNDDAKKKNESRFESCDYKGETFYLWKGWGDGNNDNITPFMKAVNESDWGITIKRN